MTNATITLNAADALADIYEARRTKFWVIFNTDSGRVTDADGVSRLGAGEALPDAAGIVTLTGIPVPSGSTNPTNFQVMVCYDAPAKASNQRDVKRERGDFGWMTVTGDANLKDLEAEQYAPPNYLVGVTGELAGYAADAEAARDAAIDISNISTPDSLVQALVKNTGGAGPLTSAALSASMAQQFLGRNVTFTGHLDEDIQTVVNATNKYTHHFIAAAGFSGPALTGYGVNADNALGTIWDMTNPGAKGQQVNLLAGTDAASRGIQLQNFGLGTLIDAATYDAAGPILTAVALGTPAANQKMIHLETLAIAGRGYFGPSLLDVYADTGIIDVTAPKFRVNGGRLSVQAIDVGYAGNKPRVNIDGGGETFAASPFLGFYGTATSTTYFASRITPNGQTMKLQGADGHAAEGAHTWGTAFLEGGYVAGLPVWAFNGQSPTSTAAVTGSRGGNVAVASLITALAAKGIVLDSTTA